jgi:hypothetical protein
MVDELYIIVRDGTKKPCAIFLSATGRLLRGRHSKGDITNVQYKPIWKCPQ